MLISFDRFTSKTTRQAVLWGLVVPVVVYECAVAQYVCSCGHYYDDTLKHVSEIHGQGERGAA